MKVTMIPVAIGTLGTIPNGLVKGLEDLEIRRQEETIQTTALFRSARILRGSWRPKETYCHSKSSERPSANAGLKTLSK